MNQTSKKKLIILPVVAILFIISACMSVDHQIIQAPQGSTHPKEINIVKASGSLPIDQEEIFINALYSELEDEDFTKGNGNSFTIKYTITKYEPGNQVLRWLAGPFGAGNGYLDVNVDYLHNNKCISKTTTKLRMKGGAFGGSYTNLHETAASEIADYVIEKFQSDN